MAPDYGIDHEQLRLAIFHDLDEYASLLLFLLAAMTYISVLENTKVFAVIDNIPVMFSVLSMQPEMDSTQWLLVTLTCGVGGSLLPMGSAAGVALRRRK